MRCHPYVVLLVIAVPLGIGAAAPPAFRSADTCSACHNGLVGPGGEDVSLGLAWRPTMMANAARDPYWQATVRRESAEHPTHVLAIEDECAICHMPMTTLPAHAMGQQGKVFASFASPLGADGVSCSVCHQIEDRNLGGRETFNGKLPIAAGGPNAALRAYGRYKIEPGLAATMRSASAFTPTESTHIQRSELCASCHTLITRALGPTGEVIGELPEQVPYLEWLASAYRSERSCQACHMSALTQPAPIASVLGTARPRLSQHTFVGGNFVMPRILNLLAGPQAVTAMPQELDGTARRTLEFLAKDAAHLELAGIRRAGDHIEGQVIVRSLAGHKLPTAYPSRRAWLHITLRDAAGTVVFESGALDARGRILGNDNDLDPARFEPHRDLISTDDEVQIYESIMVDAAGAVTTRLLSGVRYIKDNRIVPRGFDKIAAIPEVAVHGDALVDASFVAGEDRVRLRIPAQPGSLRLEVALRYQPIGYRWAESFRDAGSAEAMRFLTAFERIASGSSATLATVEASLE